MKLGKRKLAGLSVTLGWLMVLNLWTSSAQAGMGAAADNAPAPAEDAASERSKRRAAELKDVVWDKEKEGQVRIFVQPASYLHIDGVAQADGKGKIQKSEKFVAAIPVGVHVIKLSLEGYQPSEAKMTIEAGKPYSVNFTLIKEGQKHGEMISVPAGEFWMGLDEFDLSFIVEKIGGEKRYHRNESPRHKMNVAAFSIDKYEVTNQEYKKFIDATGRKEIPESWEDGAYPANLAMHPVTTVTWNDADAYCKWAGKRLPTEAEWEKAARWAPDKVMGQDDSTLYPWGNTFHRLKANTASGGAGKTAVSGQYEEGKSAYGIYDLSGNAKEWVADWYEDYPGAKFEDIFTAGDKVKVARGGSFMERDYDCLATCRYKVSPASSLDDLGFRCAKDANK